MVPSPSPPAPYHLSAGGKWIRTFGPSQGMSQIRTVGAERDIGRRKRRFLYGGTDGSNPVPSSGESGANLIFGGECHRWPSVTAISRDKIWRSNTAGRRRRHPS